MKQLTLALALLTAGTCIAAPTASFESASDALLRKKSENPFAFAHKVQVPGVFNAPESTYSGKKKVNAPTALPQSDVIHYLITPEGVVYYYTLELRGQTVNYEYFSEFLIDGFHCEVYDNTFKKIGDVDDDIALGENQSRVREVQIETQLTRKFMNYDDKFEVLVNIAFNKPDYSMDYETRVYSIGGDKDANGLTECLGKFDGYVADMVNANKDQWSEDYYVSFYTQTPFDGSQTEYADYMDSAKNIITTYRRTGYASTPTEVGRFEIAHPYLAGDQMSCPFFFSTVRNGQPMFILQHYDKWFFRNAVGPGIDPFEEDPNAGMPFDENDLVVDVYTLSNTTRKIELDHTTKVHIKQGDANPDVLWHYYGIGYLAFQNDYRADGSLNVAILKYLKSSDDDYLQTYARYDREGNLTDYLAEDVDNVFNLSDVPGQEPQVMFVSIETPEPDETGYVGAPSAQYAFVDLNSCNLRLTLDSNIANFQIKANFDRVPYRDSYLYAFETMQPYYTDNNDLIEQILWVTPEGKIERVDQVNLGQDVAAAMVNMAAHTLNPYIFNTDANTEYMWLVKRYKSATSSATDTWFTLASSNGTRLLDLGPDASKGNLSMVSLVNDNNNPALWIAYMNNTGYNQDFYTLPLNSIGGEGTAENPYQIASVGDLSQINAHPTAHFVLTNDLDAWGYQFAAVENAFTGSFDGKGHTIHGLKLADRGAFFAYLGKDSSVKNLNFVGVTVTGSSANQGVLASQATGTTIENVHVYGLKASNDQNITFGGIIGNANLYSKITNCSVSAADINMPLASTVGGIVGEVRTASSVFTCSFAGTINASDEVGGICGREGADSQIKDCHVNADLVAKNTVGGVVGYSDGGKITQCHIEGSIKATAATTQSVDFGPCAGGVVGHLKPYYANPDDITADYDPTTDPKAKDHVIFNNLVNLSSITGYTSEIAAQWPEQQTTIHRIVGKSLRNYEPDMNGNTYAEAFAADPRLSKNFANSSLDVCDSNVADNENSTEGLSVDEEDFDRAWFENNLLLNFNEGGQWNELSEYSPVLNHETGHFCSPDVLVVEEGNTFPVSVVFTGRQAMTEEDVLSQFSYDSSDENVATLHSEDYTFANNTLTLKFRAVGQGQATLSVCGAKCAVTVKENSGVEDITTGTATSLMQITAAGVAAEGCAIELYTAAGAKVAAARGFLAFQGLQNGIYIARATDAEGRTDARTVIVK